MLQIICAYAAMIIPELGSDIVFQPLKHLQAIQYKRPSVSDLGIGENSLDTDNNPIKSAEVGFYVFIHASLSLKNSKFPTVSLSVR